MKTQVVERKSDEKIMCLFFGSGRRHDFRLFKESGVRFARESEVRTDSGYHGLAKIHGNSVLPKRRMRGKELSKEDKRKNREISSGRVLNEHIMGRVKRFRILAERYRNRRKRFGLRFNLIAGICNFELAV